MNGTSLLWGKWSLPQVTTIHLTWWEVTVCDGPIVAKQEILEACLCYLLLYLNVEIQLNMFLVDNFPNLDFFSKIAQKLKWSVFFFFYSYVFVYAPKMAIRKNFILFHYQRKFRTLIKWGIVLIIKIFFRYCGLMDIESSVIFKRSLQRKDNLKNCWSIH